MEKALEIAGSLDVYAAEQLRQTLIGDLRTAESPAVDLSAVESCDAVGIQLLCAARRSAEGYGKPVAFLNPSEPVRVLWTALGMTGH
jgi:anti-anti-sigma regulatory factor